MFEVKHKEQMQNKTFRLPVALLKELNAVAAENEITLNELVRQCCQYAMAERKGTENGNK